MRFIILIIVQKYHPNEKPNNNCFYNTLFSFNNFGKNLLFLEISLNYFDEININTIKCLNTFTFLEILILSNIKTNLSFLIELFKLKEVNLNYCENIFLSENKDIKIL